MIEVAGHRFDVGAVAFDKDGTLLQVDRLWVGVLRRWIEAIADAAEAPGLARPLRIALDINEDHTFAPNGLAHCGTTADARAAAVAVLTAHHIRRPEQIVGGVSAGELDPADVVPLGDVVSTLAALKQAGLRLAVVTADDRLPTLRHLDILGVTRLLDHVICGDDLDIAPKPSGDALRWIADTAQMPVHRIAMVGDSATDIETGRNAGAGVCIGVVGDGGLPTGADLEIHTVDAIRAPEHGTGWRDRSVAS